MKNKKKIERDNTLQSLENTVTLLCHHVPLPKNQFELESENLKISRTRINSLVRRGFELLILPVNHANLSSELSYMRLYL